MHCLIFTCGSSDMRLATLVTNTDVSAFANAHPLDDAKFAGLIGAVRPNWDVTSYWVCRDAFPKDLGDYDGVMITGSPASVSDAAPWMDKLQAVIRDVIDSKIPLFGACFGHQMIAKALGARIVRNPDGWAHGAIDVVRVERMPWSGPLDSFALYGSHIEQVETLPPGAVRLFESPGCPIAGFGIGSKVFTVQHHPEMDRNFIAALIAEYADHVGPDVTERARRSLTEKPVDQTAFAEEIAMFFEQGVC